MPVFGLYWDVGAKGTLETDSPASLLGAMGCLVGKLLSNFLQVYGTNPAKKCW